MRRVRVTRGGVIETVLWVLIITIIVTVLIVGCGTTSSVVPGSHPGLTTPAVEVITDPVSVVIPAIGVASGALVPLGLDGRGQLETPPVTRPEEGGWYVGGPEPGEPGPAVIAAHVNGSGRPGLFARLHEVKAGDRATVVRTDGSSVDFIVTRVERYSKSAFPTDVVYGPTRGPELRLITCGGSFDQSARSYRDNVVVFAQLTGA